MNYPTLPGLTPDGIIYHNAAMGTLEAMVPPGPWASAHAPALLETPQGDLLCAWFAGTFEGFPKERTDGLHQNSSPPIRSAASRTLPSSKPQKMKSGLSTPPSWTESPAKTTCSTPL